MQASNEDSITSGSPILPNPSNITIETLVEVLQNLTILRKGNTPVSGGIYQAIKTCLEETQTPELKDSDAIQKALLGYVQTEIQTYAVYGNGDSHLQGIEDIAKTASNQFPEFLEQINQYIEASIQARTAALAGNTKDPADTILEQIGRLSKVQEYFSQNTDSNPGKGK